MQLSKHDIMAARQRGAWSHNCDHDDAFYRVGLGQDRLPCAKCGLWVAAEFAEGLQTVTLLSNGEVLYVHHLPGSYSTSWQGVAGCGCGHSQCTGRRGDGVWDANFPMPRRYLTAREVIPAWLDAVAHNRRCGRTDGECRLPHSQFGLCQRAEAPALAGANW